MADKDITFQDRHFKIYLSLFKWNDKKFQHALASARKKAGVDPWNPDLDEAIADFLYDYPLEQAWLDGITELGYPPGNALLGAVPGWDGEEFFCAFHSARDLVLMPNLTRFTWPNMNREIAADAIPDHPKLTHITLPTDYATLDERRRTEVVENRAILRTLLIDHGYVIISQEKYGDTVLERTR